MSANRGYLNCPPRENAQTIWRAALSRLGYFTDPPAETVAVENALGRVTASSVYARRSVPHYNGAAMDGIAVRSADTAGARETAPVRLTVLPPGGPFAAGGCFMVDTGDLMPAGTDAVIMIEDVFRSGATAEITAAAAPWQHVRIIGEDIVANDMVMPEHQAIGPVDIAALMACGLDTVEVVRKPVVAIIPTGDELVSTSENLGPGAILDVNSHMLAAAVSGWGGVPRRLPIVRDNRRDIRDAVSTALSHADMVVINAGTSAGSEDYTAQVLAELGEVLIHGVAIKPGKPVILAVCNDKPVIGLPGYPVSAMLTADLFVRDILLARQKLPPGAPPKVAAVMAKQVASALGVEEYVRVAVGRVRDRLVAAPLGRGAGVISSLTKAQGLVGIGPACQGLSAGATVEITCLRSQPPADNILAIGSHDLSLDLMGVFLRRRLGHVNLYCANVGSMGGLQAIRNNEAHIAGIHLLDEKTGAYNLPFVEKYLTGDCWQLVRLARRQQGLIVPAGNPKGITGLSDVAGSGAVFVNRQRGSGTRVLLDWQLRQLGIGSKEIEGYDKEVGTHMAVAATVAAGAAEAGLGIYAAARALGLDFIPIAEEQYDLLLNLSCHEQVLPALMEVLRSPQFRREVEALGGYDLREAGDVIATAPRPAAREGVS